MRKDPFREILESVEPLEDPTYGPLYRCSARFNKDGTEFPCVVLQSRERLVPHARRRFEGTRTGQEFRGVVEAFAAAGDRVAAYDVQSAGPSRYAIPRALLEQIGGETSMGWTGWVFEMTDGTLHSFGSGFLMEFFQLPEGYEFTDVSRERPYFTCAIDGI